MIWRLENVISVSNIKEHPRSDRHKKTRGILLFFLIKGFFCVHIQRQKINFMADSCNWWLGPSQIISNDNQNQRYFYIIFNFSAIHTTVVGGGQVLCAALHCTALVLNKLQHILPYPPGSSLPNRTRRAQSLLERHWFWRLSYLVMSIYSLYLMLLFITYYHFILCWSTIMIEIRSQSLEMIQIPLIKWWISKGVKTLRLLGAR